MAKAVVEKIKNDLQKWYVFKPARSKKSQN